MPGAWTQFHLHLLFSTKGRRELIAPEWEPRLYAYPGGIAREQRCELLAANGMPDHVHLLLRFRADLAGADLVRHLKSRSSLWVNEEGLAGQRFAWQEGYGGFTVGAETLARVKGYIAKQKQHHERVTFVDEVKAMLQRAGMEDRMEEVLENTG